MENNYVIINGELYHAGVKGMKWGRRKARPVSNGIKGGRKQNPQDKATEQAVRKQNLKRAAAIGLAATGGVLATIGLRKLSYTNAFSQMDSGYRGRAAAMSILGGAAAAAGVASAYGMKTNREVRSGQR